MAVSGIQSYSNALYQWQAQQLKSTGNSSSSSSSSSLLNSLFGGQSITSQVSSMVELTKYAMDAMGLNSDSRVTFSQINRYREQLQNEFSSAVKAGLAESGISSMAGMTFTLDANGKIKATASTQADTKLAQAWLDANPAIGQELRDALNKAGVDSSTSVEFLLSAPGKMTVTDATTQKYQALLDGKKELTANLREALSSIGVTDYPLDLAFSSDGHLQISGDHKNSVEINAWLEANPDIANTIKEQLEKDDLHYSAANLRLGDSGNIQININNADNKEIQAVLDESGELGQKLYSSLNSLGIDPNINFSIQINDDGTIGIISDHPDKDKVAAFFAANPDLVKKYRQIEALAGIDDARKAMQISPAEMRKRIQIEAMSTSWWMNSSNSSSFFGQYSDGSMSLLSGLNLNV